MSDERARMAQRMLSEARTPEERRAVEQALLRMQNNPDAGPTYTAQPEPVVHYSDAGRARSRYEQERLRALPPDVQRAEAARLLHQQNNPVAGPTYTAVDESAEAQRRALAQMASSRYRSGGGA